MPRGFGAFYVMATVIVLSFAFFGGLAKRRRSTVEVSQRTAPRSVPASFDQRLEARLAELGTSDGEPAPGTATFGRRADLAPARSSARPSTSREERPRLGSFTFLLDRSMAVDWAKMDATLNEYDCDGEWRTIAVPQGMGFMAGRTKVIMIANPMAYDPQEVVRCLKRSHWFDGDLGAVSTHTGYLTLLIDSPAEYPDKLAVAKTLTLLIGLLARQTGVVSVMNDTVGTIFSPAMVEKLVGVLHSDEIPIQLWTWTAPNSLADGDVSLTTGGLEPFLGYEVEVWNAPLSRDVVAERMSGVLRHLLINGPVLGHGETIGTSREDQSTRCFFGTSRADRPTPVRTLFLEFDLDCAAHPRKDLPLPPELRPAATPIGPTGLGRKRA